MEAHGYDKALYRRHIPKGVLNQGRPWRGARWAHSPFGPSWTCADIDQAFAVMALCPQHGFQVFVHSVEIAERMRGYVDSLLRGERNVTGAVRSITGYSLLEAQDEVFVAFGVAPREAVRATFNWRGARPLPNVTLGAKVRDQAEADAVIPILLETPAARRAVELTLRGEVDLAAIDGGGRCPICCEAIELDALNANGACRCGQAEQITPGLDMVSVGGETGPNAAPCDVGWIRSVVEQCESAGVPVLVRELGSNSGWTEPAPPVVTYRDGPRVAPTPPGLEWRPGFHRLPFRDPNGADPSEWPADLREARRRWEASCG